MNQLKRLLKHVFVLLIAASVLPTFALTETVNGITWTYTVVDGKATITDGIGWPAISPSTTGDITIPSSLGGHQVTSIGGYAFYNCANLTSVTMPDCVTSIERCAFCNCGGLMNVTIPDGVTKIGDDAFAGCSSLVSLVMPDSVRYIGSFGFYGCTSLTNFAIGAGVTHIGARAFAGCSGLTNVTIPNGVTSIQDFTFEYCAGLAHVEIPNSVALIGMEAFAGCKGLANVIIPGSVTTIERSAFSGCSKLVSLIIPNSVTNLDGYAFSGCNGLTNVIIGTGVTAIHYCTFQGCNSLMNVEIPDSVIGIGDGAFNGCNKLFDETTIPGVRLVDGWVVGVCGSLSGNLNLTGVRGVADGSFDNSRDLTSVTIPDSAIGIGYGAFSRCTGLTELTLPFVGLQRGNDYSPQALLGFIFGTKAMSSTYETWQSYDSSSTSYCIPPYLRSIVVTDETIIGHKAFSNCRYLTNVTVCTGVTSVGDYAFSGCSGLMSMTIPNSVTNIGASSFYGCTNLTSVTIPQCVLDRRIGNVFPAAYSSLTNVSYSSIITNIGPSAFSGCSGLTSVTIPDGVTNIEGRAFYGCSGLTSVTIPDRVTSIGEWAFSGCRGLCNLSFDGNAPSVGANAFSGVNPECEVRVLYGSEGWNIYASETWNGLKIDYTIPCVLFYGNGGIVDKTELETNDGVIDFEMPTATRVGYAFAGWFTDAAGGDEIVSGMTLDGSVRVYAHWMANEYTLSLDPNGGQIGESEINVRYDAEYGVLPTPARAGYSFSGWRLDGTNVTQSTIVKTANDHVLTAAWTPNRYSVTFNPNGGSVDGSTSTRVTFDSAYGQLPVPTRTGYTFVGWMMDDAMVKSDTVVAVAGNHELVAEWSVNQYLVTFDANGGEGGTSATMDYGAEILAPIVMREGCTFEGWEPSVPATVPASNVTFAAKWKFWDVKVDSTATNLKTLYPDDYQNITNVVLPSGITEIPAQFFDGCSSLVAVTIPESVTNIGERSFNNCRNLAYLTLPDGVTGIGSYAFAGCNGLTSVTIPQSACARQMLSIFPSSYRTIKNIVIAEGVTYLCDNMFAGCTALETLSLPDSLVDFGNNDMRWWAERCWGAEGLCIKNGCVLGYVGSAPARLTIPERVRGIVAYALCEQYDLQEIVLPSTLTYIGAGAFYEDTYLDNVFIPDGVETIGDCAFQDCSYLQTLTLGGGVKSVGNYAFAGCSQLASAVFADGLVSIGEGAFDGCWRMQSVSLPLSTERVDSSAFNGCSSLTGVTVPTHGGTMYDWFNPVYPQILDVTIPTGETEVVDGMFAGCSAMRNVGLPEGVTNIGAYAFQECGGLAEITLPSSVERIGDWAFQDCGGITSVVLPESVVQVGTGAFYGCGRLADVTLSRGLTELSNNLFNECWSLDSLVVPESVTYLGCCFAAPNMTAIYYLGDAPECASGAYDNTSWGLTSYVVLGTKGWDGRPNSRDIPQTWNDRNITTWTANKFNVTFDANGGNFEGEGTVATSYVCEEATDTGYVLPPYEPVRPRYTFNGYWTESAAGTRITGSVRVKLTKAHKLYAHWLKGTPVTVRFNANGGSVTPASQTVASGAVGTLPTPVRYMYVFLGWFTEANGGTKVTASTKVTEDVTYYAHWQYDGSGLVTAVVADGCAGMGTVTGGGATVKAGTKVALKATPNAGCVFVGWSCVGDSEPYQTGEILSQSASWSYVATGEPVTLEAVFATTVDDAASLEVAVEDVATEADGTIGTTGTDGTRAFDLGACVGSLSEPKITVKGLPTGLKFDAKTGTVSGKATKPGVYTVTVSATNATVKKPVTATFEIVVPNISSEKLPGLEPDTEAYGKIVCGVAFDPGIVDCAPEDGWTLKAAGLPAGLKLVQDKATGAYSITGVPTKAGMFTVTFTASKKGEANQVATITLNVEAAPEWAVGTFSGWVAGTRDACPYQGAATMTVAANGKISGKIALDGTNWTFKADSYSEVRRDGVIAPYQNGVVETNFVINAVATAGKAKREMELRVVDGGGGGGATALPGMINAKADGESDDGEWSLALWRNVWKDKATAAAAKTEIAKLEGVYTLSLDSGADYGSGYLSLTVGKDGNVKATGKLADGTSASATSPLMYDEEEGWFAYLYAAPSAYKGGAFAAAVGFDGGGESGGGHAGRVTLPCGPARWTSRDPQATGEYGAGFDREVSFVGAYYNKLDVLRKYYEALRLSFGGGLGETALPGAPALAYTYKETHLNESGKKVTEAEGREINAINTLGQAGLTAAVNEKGAFVVEKATKPVQDKTTKAWSYGGANDGAMTLSFAQATGIFKGSYTFWYDYMSAFDATKPEGKQETWTHTSKKVNFEGVLVQGESEMRGFYLWDATGGYEDSKPGKPKTYKYKESYPVLLR